MKASCFLKKLLVRADSEVENVIGSCHVVVKSLAILSSVVTWKIEKTPKQMNDLSKEIFRNSCGGAAWVFLITIVKCKKREIS